MTDDELMRSCGTGAVDAFGELFERYRTTIWGFFRRRVADRARAEDLSQDTFMALFTSAPRYEARGTFRSYLFGIAYHVLSEDRRRPAAPTATTRDGFDMSTLTAVSADMDDVLLVRRAIAALDVIDRDVLMLREFESLSYAEIAGALDIPVNTVRSRLFRARMALKEKLQ